MKDYYSILHVLPSAEIDVIKAAYKALARKYHPDTYAGDKAYAGKRMQEINDAFGVIGDPENRKKYDAERKAANSQNDYCENGEDVDAKTEENVDAQTEANWIIACKYSPDAEINFKQLHRLSRALAFTYKSYLMESKKFNKCNSIKEQMEESFLKTYFGDNTEIRALAKSLVLQGNKKAALEVNRAVKVMGDSLDINSLKKQIYASLPMTDRRIAFYNAKHGVLPTPKCKKLLETFGYRCEYNGIMTDSYRIEGDGEIFNSVPADDLNKWIVTHFQNHPDCLYI